MVFNGEVVRPSVAAKRLGVRTPTVIRYIHDGKLPASRLPSGQLRIRIIDVEQLLIPVED